MYPGTWKKPSRVLNRPCITVCSVSLFLLEGELDIEYQISSFSFQELGHVGIVCHAKGTWPGTWGDSLSVSLAPGAWGGFSGESHMPGNLVWRLCVLGYSSGAFQAPGTSYHVLDTWSMLGA